jgi:hypothetical protein
MMYVHPPSLSKLKQDLAQFIRAGMTAEKGAAK